MQIMLQCTSMWKPGDFQVTPTHIHRKKTKQTNKTKQKTITTMTKKKKKPWRLVPQT